jgi:hypothetical protein
MIPGFVEVDSITFYEDIWPRIKNDVEILETIRNSAKKGVRSDIIAWGYKDHTKEKLTVAINLIDDTEEKYWVDSTLIQRL